MACANIVSLGHINKIIVLAATAIAFISIGGCAKKPPAPGEAAAASTERVSLRLDPTTPAGVVALPKELMAHPRSVYSANTDKYSYFIGDQLLAEYNPESLVLVLTGAGAAEGMVCKYSPDGALFTGPQEPTGQQADVGQCNALITQLYQHMQR